MQWEMKSDVESITVHIFNKGCGFFSVFHFDLINLNDLVYLLNTLSVIPPTSHMLANSNNIAPSSTSIRKVFPQLPITFLKIQLYNH